MRVGAQRAVLLSALCAGVLGFKAGSGLNSLTRSAVSSAAVARSRALPQYSSLDPNGCAPNAFAWQEPLVLSRESLIVLLRRHCHHCLLSSPATAR